MKLLIYCYEYPPLGGGAGNALAHLARVWAREGHAVTVVTSHHGALPLESKEDGVDVVRLRVGRKSESRGRIPEMLRYMTQSRQTAAALYAKTRPDLAVAFLTLPSGAAPLYLKEKYRLPFVSELRGGDVPGFLPDLLGIFHLVTTGWIRSVWTASACVIANSQGLADLARKTAPQLRVQVVPNGVDTQTFRPMEGKTEGRDRPAGTAVGPPETLCRCLFVGRLVDGQKQIGRLIDAAAHQPNLEIVIVGAGPDEAKLRQRAAKSSAADRIHFKGWLKGPDLLKTYQAADLYVSASVGEGMSNSALEALACGLPLVLSRISGHQELVEAGTNGFLFDPNSAQELEHHLRRLAADPQECRRLGRASRERAVRHFDWAELAHQHLELYRRALSA